MPRSQPPRNARSKRAERAAATLATAPAVELLPGEKLDLTGARSLSLDAVQRREAQRERQRHYRAAKKAKRAAEQVDAPEQSSPVASSPVASSPVASSPVASSSAPTLNAEELAMLQRNLAVRENIAMRQKILLGPSISRAEAFERELADAVKARLGIDCALYDVDPESGALTLRE